jgi:hypothetical protein
MRTKGGGEDLTFKKERKKTTQQCSEYLFAGPFIAGRSPSTPSRGGGGGGNPILRAALHDGQAPCESYHALYRKSDLCIPRNETTRPRSQFLHLCIFERYIHICIRG